MEVAGNRWLSGLDFQTSSTHASANFAFNSSPLETFIQVFKPLSIVLAPVELGIEVFGEVWKQSAAMKMCWIQKLRQNECILVKMKALISELSNYELDNTELQITFGQLLFWEPTNFKLLGWMCGHMCRHSLALTQLWGYTSVINMLVSLHFENLCLLYIYLGEFWKGIKI